MSKKSQDFKILSVIQEYLLLNDINNIDKLISQCALNPSSIWGNLAVSVLEENSLQNSKAMKEKIIKSKKIQRQISDLIHVIKKQSKFNKIFK